DIQDFSFFIHVLLSFSCTNPIEIQARRRDTEGMASLPEIEVLRVCTVLEDSLDQLAVLGYIMPVSYQGRNNTCISDVWPQVATVVQWMRRVFEVRRDENTFNVTFFRPSEPPFPTAHARPELCPLLPGLHNGQRMRRKTASAAHVVHNFAQRLSVRRADSLRWPRTDGNVKEALFEHAEVTEFAQERARIVGSELGKILKTQRQVEGNFEDLMGTRADIQLSSPPVLSKLLDLKVEVHETSEKLKMSNVQFTKAVRQSPLTSDNLKKVQADRQFAADIIANMLMELETSGSFLSLERAVAMEKEKKEDLYNIIEREQEGRKKIKLLQKQLQDVKQEKKVELQSRTELIAHLKDQLQEMKAKTSMEGRYVKKDSDLQVSQTQKKCNTAESDLLMELQKMKEKVDEEIRVHVEIENFLRQHQQELEEKLEYWMEKYDKDTEEKQAELNALKTSRANDLSLLNELAKQVRGANSKGPFTLSDAAAIPTTIRIAAASLFVRWRAVTQTALQRPTMPVTRVNIGQYRRSAEHSAGGQTAVDSGLQGIGV
ncbi:unnamed protein product, partial [Ranitomeya imitator]